MIDCGAVSLKEQLSVVAAAGTVAPAALSTMPAMMPAEIFAPQRGDHILMPFNGQLAAGWPYTATTTVRSRLFSVHTPMAVLRQSCIVARDAGSYHH